MQKLNVVKCPICYMRTIDIFMVSHLYYSHNIKTNLKTDNINNSNLYVLEDEK